MKSDRLWLAKRVNLGLAGGIAAWFFFLPGLTVLRDLTDPALRSDTVPRAARRLFHALTPRYRRWAEARVARGRAAGLTPEQIAATEWPLFGSVFYLWAVEELQAEWERSPAPRGPAPRDTARGAIEAAVALVLDPAHAKWVRDHWGENYLERENVFYRALLIAAMDSHYRLTGNPCHLPRLRAMADALANELDRSPFGLLDDYPGQCYPTDVMMAVALIRRAGPAVGRDYSAFAERAIRGFEGGRLDRLGLPPYDADARRGVAGPARGCGLSYAGMSAPYLWPDRARDWFERYEEHFWQERHGLHGFREFPRGASEGSWYFDVDSGPVIGGVGVSASAFGLAAARTMGRFDRAWPLAAQTLVFGWPLPDGTLLTARLLSNAAHAPYLGEACILYNLTRRAAPGMAAQTGGSLPPVAVAGSAAYFLLGALFAASEWCSLRRWRRRAAMRPTRAPRLQWIAWLTLLGAAVLIAVLFGPTPGFLVLVPALLFPAQFL